MSNADRTFYSIWLGAAEEESYSSLSDSGAGGEVCVFDEQSQSCRKQQRGGWRGGEYVDPCAQHGGKGVELHLS